MAGESYHYRTNQTSKSCLSINYPQIQYSVGNGDCYSVVQDIQQFYKQYRYYMKIFAI